MAGHYSKTKLYLPQYRILTSIDVNRIKHETTTYSMQSVLSGVSFGDIVNDHGNR